ncbi:cobaltochelatase subunit CobN [Devosia pacifica]|uniref:Cobaltochelatase subunit CobN n=1 Tax=Devosia pacifica TaxID=1335967 RepID=A0A918SA32_9HYPH|nr:cobaltochelatase subunit CobN [Devosia pacifica]GHA30913.1 cobaltochelatase subunit CobN [Devosia pacifica]
MHLLSAQAGALQQEGEAIDLGQAPGRIVFASAADSELAMLADAADRAGAEDLRLANLLRLTHNMSVDLWLDQTVRHARLVVLRLLGGAAYFQYGVDELTTLCADNDIALVLLPGDANPDQILMQRSSVPPETWSRLHALFTAGGPENADALLDAFGRSADGKALADDQPSAFARFGHWDRQQGTIDPELNSFSPDPARAIAPILFYRSLLEGGGAAMLRQLCEALVDKGIEPLPLVISTLKESACVRFVQRAFSAFPPQVILNLTGFALGLADLDDKANPFAGTDAPILQLLQNNRPEAQWREDTQGLGSRDLAMQVVLPELDGRIGMLLVGHKREGIWHERTQCPLTAYAPDASGIARAATLAANWVRLRTTDRAGRKVGMVLANYPIRDGRLANGVGYDAPQSSVEILKALATAGYHLEKTPDTGNALIERLQAGPTNAAPSRGNSPAPLSLARYQALFATLPAPIREQVSARWGAPQDDPFVRDGAFQLPLLILGNVAILLQPARGYDRDDAASYHDPDLVPPHAYCAAYLWLHHEFGAHALIHNGKHGNLEWLPGKATALDAASYPDALWGHLPHLYPFIVNDPGEGTQAKRRTGAVIIDHLVPPLTRAEIYGPLKDLEAMLDEYYAASGMDRRRLVDLKRRILAFTRDIRLDRDITLPDDGDAALVEIDNFLCELKEAQIRDGLHIFGQSPTGRLERDLALAMVRVPRGEENAADASLIRALADDLKLGFDPLTAILSRQWSGPAVNATPCRTLGDAVEALEALAGELVSGERLPDAEWGATRAVLETLETIVRPRLAASGPNEIKALLDGLDGRFVAPGPSGAPSRGRLDVLPTGRNFYSVDNRAVPTQTAWELGRKSAENLVLRHMQDNGTYLRSIALSVWGTANMRTGGDDIAQALALIGAKPKWDPSSLRVSGYEIIPMAKLGRPRVDVTLRISGFFRDAFPAQIALFDKAVRAIGALDEPEDQNPIAARMRTDALGLMKDGQSEEQAALAAGHRIFGSKPGAYGAGLQGLMDSGNWSTKGDIAEAFLNWGQYAYGAHASGTPERDRLKARLGDIEAVVHNQDNREHDLLDSDDYYQFEGGLTATAEALTGRKPATYHNDHSRPERPLTRTLDEEISRVMRSRVANPKWIDGVRRHGYKGAFEIIATVDYMFAFAATTGAVKSHHFDLAFEAFVENDDVRDFLVANNRYGYDELLAKFRDAITRGFWQPRSNSVHAVLDDAKTGGPE